ncbi:MAG: glutamyl-tRNA reductase [Verrucomicrobiota bacterium]|jgi:glutamyl-tRNA reductase
MNLFCVGVNHRTANVATRERFTGDEKTASLLRQVGCAEALLLNTCNRVEVYGAAEQRLSREQIAHCLTRDGSAVDTSAFYHYEGTDCVLHLFRVAAGIDSMVVGETEILGQTKKAYESARCYGGAGPYLHRLFQRAFRVAKQVRTHTEITRGSVSIGSVAVELAGKIFGNLADRKVLVLGAGETSERTVRALVSRGVSDLRVSNRSIERAHELASTVGGLSIAFDQWLEQCREIDILIASTSSETFLVTRDLLEPILRERIDRPLFIIDIAVPRNIDPAVNQLGSVYLYDVDALHSVAQQSLDLRRQQITAAETIIAEHVQNFQETLARGTARSGCTERSAIRIVEQEG